MCVRACVCVCVGGVYVCACVCACIRVSVVCMCVRAYVLASVYLWCVCVRVCVCGGGGGIGGSVHTVSLLNWPCLRWCASEESVADGVQACGSVWLSEVTAGHGPEIVAGVCGHGHSVNRLGLCTGTCSLSLAVPLADRTHRTSSLFLGNGLWSRLSDPVSLIPCL